MSKSGSKHKSGEKGVFTDELKLKFIKAYLDSNFSVTKACKVVGISRFTYYYTMDHDEDFINKIKLAKELAKITIQSALLEGLSSDDLELRQTYLKLLPPKVISEAMGVGNDATDTKISLSIEDFIG